MLLDSFRHCFSNLPEATLLVSATDGIVIETNSAAKLLLRRGMPVVGRAIADLVGDPLEKVARLLVMASRSRDVTLGALEFKVSEQGSLPCRIEAALFSTPPAERLLLVRVFPKAEAVERFRTLNDRIEALNREVIERRRAEARLFAQQELLRATLASIGDGAIATDARGTITFMNGVAQSLTGWNEQDAIGKPLEKIFAITNETTGLTVESPASKVFAEGKIVGLANHTKLTSKDGRHMPIDDSAAPIRDVDGNLMGVVLVFRDVTARRDAERAVHESIATLRARERELTRANDDLNQFAFAASHDLQEPLRMISSYSQLLLKGYSGELNDEAGLCVRFITEGIHRMRELLADLLTYTQVNVEDRSLHETADLSAALQTAVSNCKSSIEETHATVTAGDMPTAVPGHEPHFVQLLQNLIGNSIKYRGEQPPRIHIGIECDDSAWKLSVRDNGIGIDPMFHQTIFGVFKRLHGRDIAGTGIGLAICKRVIDRLGGSIWVESAPGAGTTVYCTFPATKRTTA